MVFQQIQELLIVILIYGSRLIWIAVIGWALFVAGMYLFIRRSENSSRFSRVGRTLFYAARYCSSVVRAIRNSNFYLPLRQLIRRDPTFLMLFLFAVLVIFLSTSVLRSVITVLTTFFLALQLLTGFAILKGLWLLLGTLIIGYVVFLMTMMLIMFINYLFGFGRKIAGFASRFVNPWLLVLQSSGIPPNWSFFVLYIILGLFQQAFSMFFMP